MALSPPPRQDGQPMAAVLLLLLLNCCFFLQINCCQRCCSSIFTAKMCVFLTRPPKCQFSMENTTSLQIGLLAFFEKSHISEKNMDIVDVFVEIVNKTTTNP